MLRMQQLFYFSGKFSWAEKNEIETRQRKQWKKDQKYWMIFFFPNETFSFFLFVILLFDDDFGILFLPVNFFISFSISWGTRKYRFFLSHVDEMFLIVDSRRVSQISSRTCAIYENRNDYFFAFFSFKIWCFIATKERRNSLTFSQRKETSQTNDLSSSTHFGSWIFIQRFIT